MNQGRIWTVVKPTVGLPLFLGSVAVTSLARPLRNPVAHDLDVGVLAGRPWREDLDGCAGS